MGGSKKTPKRPQNRPKTDPKASNRHQGLEWGAAGRRFPCGHRRGAPWGCSAPAPRCPAAPRHPKNGFGAGLGRVPRRCAPLHPIPAALGGLGQR